MANAKIDENGRQTMIGLLNTNGSTITRIQAAAATHSLKADDDTTGSDNGGDYSHLDENSRGAMYALSSSDGVTKVALYVNSSGELLIDSA